ncbi:MAG: orotate phosphoribosyltransferase [Elusimicrobiota bacterium]|jgi:orotate phosphoribosyltransferase
MSLLPLFRRSGALLEGHFRLSSGLHAERYFQCALVLSDPRAAARLGRALAAEVRLAGWKPDLVVSPALGGVVIGHEAARALGTRAYFTERGPDGLLALRRGFRLERGERVLVVEDVVTTGKSTSEVAALVRAHGARPVGAAAIVLRGERAPRLGMPLRALAHLPAAGWAPATCPLCARGLPLVKPGSRPESPSQEKKACRR